MKDKNSDLDQWMKEIRQASTAALSGGDIKALNCFFTGSRSYLSYLRFKASLNRNAIRDAKTKKKQKD